MRPFREDDLDAFAAHCADDEVMRWLGGTMDRPAAWRHMATLTVRQRALAIRRAEDR